MQKVAKKDFDTDMHVTCMMEGHKQPCERGKESNSEREEKTNNEQYTCKVQRFCVERKG